MRSLASLLPSHLVRSLAERGAPRRLPHVEKLPAALMLSDLDGFAALTERLQARGAEGAEEVTDLVRTAFRPAIAAIHRRGGSIVSFGGDALFVVFPGAGAVARARAAAEEVRHHFLVRGAMASSAGPVRLGISQAIHYGTARAIHLGTEDRRLYLVCGGAVTALARLEARVEPGGLRMSRAAARRAGDRPRPRGPAARPPASVLRRYVAPHLGALLGHFEGELRTAAIAFFETRGAPAAALQRFVLHLWRVLDDHGGILVGTDPSALGTKWLCAFGAPVAHEDAADRAARAGLAIVGGALRGLPVRGSVHVGRAAAIWMGAEGRRSFEVMGDVTNTAARALGLSRWGELVTTEETRRELSATRTRERGRHAVKGKERPLEIHALESASAAARPIRVTAPMVGRGRELSRIREALALAVEGRGSTLCVTGAAGLGKSRLKWEAAKIASGMGVEVLEARAPAFGGRPWGTIADILRAALGGGRPRDALRGALSRAARRLSLDQADRRHLADLLDLGGDAARAPRLAPSDRRSNDMLAIRNLLRAHAAGRPQLWVMEDMHWSDEMTRDAVAGLAPVLSDRPAVLLLIARPGYAPPAGSARIELEELPPADVEAMLGSLLPGVPSRVVRLVMDKAAGNPFYVEEVVRHLLDRGVLRRAEGGFELIRDPAPGELPGTVEAVIAARLDGLPPAARRVAEIGALVGRTFPFEVVARLDAGAMAGVRELTRRELLFVRSHEPGLEYIWKHALTRDVIYGRILAGRRRRLHGAVADALEATLPEDHGDRQAMLGHHRELAGQPAEARRCYLAAAREAVHRSAPEEAERSFRRYLALGDAPTPESVAVRIELARGVYRMLGRIAESEVEHERALQEARGLADRAGEARALGELAVTYHITGRYAEARAAFEQALAVNATLGDGHLHGILLGRLADVHRELGELDVAEALYGRALVALREAGDRRFEGSVLSNLGNLETARSRPREARDYHRRALALARDAGDRITEAIALGNLASMCLSQGHLQEARALYERSIPLARQAGFRRFEAFALGGLADLARAEGHLLEARARYETAVTRADAGDDRVMGCALRGNLAGVLSMLGEVTESRGRYGEALAAARQSGARRHEGIVLAGLGTLERWWGDPAIARRHYEDALAILHEVDERRHAARVTCEVAQLDIDDGLLGPARARLDEALATSRATDDPVTECDCLCGLATLDFLGGEVAQGLARSAEAAALRDRIGRGLELLELECTLGHAALAAGLDGGPYLARARALAAASGAAPPQRASRLLMVLERALQAPREGRARRAGYAPEDLSPALRRRAMEPAEPRTDAGTARDRRP